jgi:hypothetical protein
MSVPSLDPDHLQSKMDKALPNGRDPSFAARLRAPAFALEIVPRLPVIEDVNGSARVIARRRSATADRKH